MILRIGFIIFALFLQVILAQEAKLLPFKIKDQFKNEFSEKEFQEQLSIIIGSDKDGTKYNSAWGSAISDSLESYGFADRYKIFPLADLRGVPFFLKGLIRGKFPKEKEKWCLMDWKGHFAKNYQFVEEKSNILVFSEAGTLLYKDSMMELNPEQLQAILIVIKNELSNKQGVN